MPKFPNFMSKGVVSSSLRVLHWKSAVGSGVSTVRRDFKQSENLYKAAQKAVDEKQFDRAANIFRALVKFSPTHAKEARVALEWLSSRIAEKREEEGGYRLR